MTIGPHHTGTGRAESFVVHYNGQCPNFYITPYGKPTMAKGPVFTPEWPRYAVWAHVVCWTVSALFLLSCVAGYGGLIGGQVVISLFWLTIASAFGLSLAAAFSGRLYVGNQVFSRRPIVGWVARSVGVILAAVTAFIMFFAYGLLYMFP